MNTNDARQKLETTIVSGTARAGAMVQHVLNTIPEDTVARASSLSWDVTDHGALLMAVSPEANMQPVHSHAVGQIVSHLDIDIRGFRAMVEGTESGDRRGGKRFVEAPPWKRALAVTMLGQYFGNAKSRHLVRSVNGVRGFLSDSFRRLDCRPLLDAFVSQAMAHGAQPYTGHVTDLKVAIKVIVPQVYEVVPGEPCAFGLEFGNSDFGAGGLTIRSFLLRLACLNGATTEDVMRKVHLGGRLSDDVEYSVRTLQADTHATRLALGDTVRAALMPAKREELVERIRTAQEQEITWDRLKTRIAKDLTKEELAAVERDFNGPDVVNLPPEPTMWRASNALSWLANSAKTDGRGMELERLAGTFLPKVA